MNNETSLDRKLVGQSLYDQLRNDITIGDLKPGEKLKLNQLKARYGVSVNTLRETLMRLVVEGFATFEDQKGFGVAAASLADLEELIELRVLLEVEGVRKSFEHSSTLIDWKSKVLSAHFKLNQLELKMMEDRYAHMAEWGAADRAFHQALVSNCGSKQLIRYHSSIIEQYMRYQVLALHERPFRGESVIEEHKALVQLLLDDQVDELILRLKEHIQRGQQEA